MIGAIIGAAAAIGGSLLSSSAAKKGAKQAADSQLAVAQQNNALVRENRDFLAGQVQPFANSGQRANALIDSFLYPPAPQAAAPQPFAAPIAAEPSMGDIHGLGTEQWDESPYLSPRGFEGRTVLPARPVQGMTAPTIASPGVPGTVGTTAPSGPSGYDAFVASPYYQNPLREGMEAINKGYAARGILQSGAALRQLNRYGQDYGAGRMDEFIRLAQGQQATGLQGVGILGGVTTNALTATTGNNQNAADAAANAAIMRAQAQNQMYGSIGNALGGLTSSFFPK